MNNQQQLFCVGVNRGAHVTQIQHIDWSLILWSIRELTPTGPLKDSGRQNDEKMWREAVHSQSYATFFRHSDVLSVPAVLLRKLPINEFQNDNYL